MSALQLLKRLYATPDDPAALAERLTELNAELVRAENTAVAAREGYGRRITGATSTADLDSIDAELAQKIGDVTRLSAAREAVESRLQRARAAEAERDMGKAWDACEAALKARRTAFEKLTKALEAAGQAQIAAEDAAREAYRLLPVKFVEVPGTSGMTLSADFLYLGTAVHNALTVAAMRSDEINDSTLWDLKQLPSLAEQHDKAAEQWLSCRHPQPVLPDAA